jgi:hypothetical protein
LRVKQNESDIIYVSYCRHMGYLDFYIYTDLNNRREIENTYDFQLFRRGYYINKLKKEIYNSMPKIIKKIISGTKNA